MNVPRASITIGTTRVDDVVQRTIEPHDVDLGTLGMVRVYHADGIHVGTIEEGDGDPRISVIVAQQGCQCGCARNGRALLVTPSAEHARQIGQKLIDMADQVDTQAKQSADDLLAPDREGIAGMKARPVKFVRGASTVVRDQPMETPPQRISIGDETYWCTSANGCAIATVTRVGSVDHRTGALSIVTYADAQHGMADGLALLRTFSVDDAEIFANQMLKAAADIRELASEQADAALRKAAGR